MNHIYLLLIVYWEMFLELLLSLCNIVQPLPLVHLKSILFQMLAKKVTEAMEANTQNRVRQ